MYPSTVGSLPWERGAEARGRAVRLAVFTSWEGARTRASLVSTPVSVRSRTVQAAALSSDLNFTEAQAAARQQLEQTESWRKARPEEGRRRGLDEAERNRRLEGLSFAGGRCSLQRSNSLEVGIEISSRHRNKVTGTSMSRAINLFVPINFRVVGQVDRPNYL